jgi:hypothetical protein
MFNFIFGLISIGNTHSMSNRMSFPHSKWSARQRIQHLFECEDEAARDQQVEPRQAQEDDQMHVENVEHRACQVLSTYAAHTC